MKDSVTGVSILKSGTLVNYKFFKDAYKHSMLYMEKLLPIEGISLSSVTIEFIRCTKYLSKCITDKDLYIGGIFDEVGSYCAKHPHKFTDLDEEDLELLLIELVNVRVSSELVTRSFISENIDLEENRDISKLFVAQWISLKISEKK